LTGHKIPPGAIVLDLGSGQGVTSIFLAKEYGFKVYAADLWSDPEENQIFFSEMGLTVEQLVAVKADVAALPFEKDFFDAVISVDSYHYFGRDPDYLDSRLLPFVKYGTYIYIAIPGMKQDCHENLPQELLLSWNPEQLAFMRDAAYWTRIAEGSREAKIVSIHEMESFDEVWNDWLEQETMSTPSTTARR
jgi:cyclopropane fatty-acyl-phospholipid synthase-like methyltransferase